MATISDAIEIEYPESDGRPMGESDLHRDWMVRIIELLKYHFRGQRVYVTGDLLLYYEQGNPRRVVVPDAFVVKDSDPGRRPIYKLWVEGKPPDFAMETSSKTTQQVDLVTKCALCARLGVKEYFTYDPTGDYLSPPLLAYRLSGTGYVPLEPDESGAITSEELGLIFRVDGGDLVMMVRETGQRLLTAEEREKAAQERERAAQEREHEAGRQAEREAAARQAAEAELARLRDELARRSSNP